MCIRDSYQTMKLNIFEYTFDEHDETVAYSLSIPFVSTFVFAAVMKDVYKRQAIRTGLTRRQVYEQLIHLAKLHIVSYIPRKKTPYILSLIHIYTTSHAAPCSQNSSRPYTAS